MLFSPQIPLPLEPGRSASLDEFVVGPNGNTVEAVRQLVAQPEQCLYLHGPSGSGKSYLLNAACLAVRERGFKAFYLNLDGLAENAAASLLGLETMNLVCLDGIDEVVGNAVWEEAIFHFINRLREARGSLVVTSRIRLRDLEISLPDLKSRLSWGLRLELQTLDDEGKSRVLQNHASRQGFEIPADVLKYLQRNGPRNMRRMLGIVDRLQESAFIEKRAITVPLARQAVHEGETAS